MSFTKRTTPISAQLVEFETPLPAAEITARLDRALNRAEAAKLHPILASAHNKDDIIREMSSLIGDSGFIFFSALPHHSWLNKFFQRSELEQFPVVSTYTLGNPLIAQTILQHDLRAAVGIPPRLLVLGLPSGGTKILYHLPSSILAAGADRNGRLRSALEGLDEKLERFVERIIAGEF